jgi:hypothetical protein
MESVEKAVHNPSAVSETLVMHCTSYTKFHKKIYIFLRYTKFSDKIYPLAYFGLT